LGQKPQLAHFEILRRASLLRMTGRLWKKYGRGKRT
jgi:hypothetical protein